LRAYENSNDNKENTAVPAAGVIKRNPPLLLQIGERRMPSSKLVLLPVVSNWYICFIIIQCNMILIKPKKCKEEETSIHEELVKEGIVKYCAKSFVFNYGTSCEERRRRTRK
jgi:hypothetical protein